MLSRYFFHTDLTYWDMLFLLSFIFLVELYVYWKVHQSNSLSLSYIYIYIYIYMRNLYLSRQLRDSLSWCNVAEFQPLFLVLVPWSQFYMRTVIISQYFYEDCCHDRSLFLRTATMVAVLITLKLYDFLGLRSCYSGLRPCCSKFATILK